MWVASTRIHAHVKFQVASLKGLDCSPSGAKPFSFNIEYIGKKRKWVHSGGATVQTLDTSDLKFHTGLRKHVVDHHVKFQVASVKGLGASHGGVKSSDQKCPKMSISSLRRGYSPNR